MNKFRFLLACLLAMIFTGSVSTAGKGNADSKLPRFVVISDTHFGNTVGGETAEVRVTRALKNLFSHKPTPDAIFIVGDMTQRGKVEQYEQLLSVFSDKANVPEGVEVFYIMGFQHDKSEDGDPKNFLAVLKKPLHQSVEIKGYPFVYISEGGRHETPYNLEARRFLEEKMADAAAKHPGKPIFVFMHIPPVNTCYGSGKNDGWGTDFFMPALSKYPQAIVFSGHSHFPVGDPRSIHQEIFTSVNDGSSAGSEIEPGLLTRGIHPENNENVTEGLIVNVLSGGNVEIERWDTYRNEEILPRWTVEAPHDGSRFAYKNRDGLPAPAFERNAAVNVEAIQTADSSCVVVFPQASDNEVVHHYLIEILDGTATVASNRSFSQFYLNSQMPGELKVKFNGLPLSRNLVAQVTALDSYKNASTPLKSRSFRVSDTVFISALGLAPNSRENAVPYVARAIEACRGKAGAVVSFPRGRYDFWTQHSVERIYFESNTQDINPKRLAILVEQADGLTIDGNGSEFVFHDRIQPFTVDNSRNISIKNLSVDWDIPLTAQAVVANVADAYIDLKINIMESPYVIENGTLVFVGEGWKSRWWGAMEFAADTKLVVPPGENCLGDGWQNYRAEELSPGLIRLHNGFKRKPATGNLLVMRHSNRDHSGIFIVDSKNVSVENVNLYHYPGLGILSQYSENLTYTNVNCIPNPKKGRILSGHDDGFQVSNCRGDVVVKNCIFHALMDDPINVHGTSVRITGKMNANTLRCQFMHHESVGMVWARSGDSVAFIDNQTMHSFATGTVKSFRKIDNSTFDVSFSQDVPSRIAVGNALENLTWTCNVSITGSEFRSCRARGLLLSTPGRVVIENNIFESSGSAILIAGDANYWYESGGVRNVRIAKNRFEAPCLTAIYQFCEGVISIMPIIPKPDVKTPAFHSNIVITDNEFHLFDYPILYALSVDNIEFSNNRLVRSRRFEPFHSRKHGLTFEYCKKITVKGNTQEGDILGKDVVLIHSNPKELKLGKGDIFKLK